MRRLFASLFLAAALVVPARSAHAGTVQEAIPPTDAGTPSGHLDASGRYLVVTRSGAKVGAVRSRHVQREGLTTERVFTKALRGFAGRMSAAQVAALKADPDVVAVVPDEVVGIARTTPTGVIRVGGLVSPLANIDTVDERVDADVAVVDTGIDPFNADLNVVGGYNCTSANPANWKDWNNHGTHVAGTIGAIDNSSGVVGVAPGVRLWAVRILNGDGFGYLSWYICGLDWIAAQRDPVDSSRALIEAVNMSVTKWGSDDAQCGFRNSDVLHQAVCRVTQQGITVVAAAANDAGPASRRVPASYNEVITVSALADTDGRPGGTGGHRCYSWGTYDRDDTFADFSNYGSDIDLIAPGKCIWSTRAGGSYGYSSGTSMAAPHVTGAAALYKSSRPMATPAEVREALRYLGSTWWYRSTDPDPYHEPLLRVDRIGVLGTFSLSPGAPATIGSKGGSVNAPFIVNRSSTFFERVRFRVDSVPSGWTASFVTASNYGFAATSASVRVTAPISAKPGSYQIQVSGTNWGRTKSTTLTVNVAADVPTASAPTASVLRSSILGRTSTGVTTVSLRATWAAATDPSDPIARYEVQRSVNGGAFGWTVATSGSARWVSYSGLSFGAQHRFRIRAQDTDGSWSAWATSGPTTPLAISDRSSLVTYSRYWWRYDSPASTGGGITSSRLAGATATHRFTGRAIAIVAPTNVSRGRMSVYIDGVYKATVDLYSSTTTYRKVVYSASWATSKTRTIELRVAGTSGRPTVSLDGFVVLR
jgi:subtilisin family serine protease